LSYFRHSKAKELGDVPCQGWLKWKIKKDTPFSLKWKLKMLMLFDYMSLADLKVIIHRITINIYINVRELDL
jgi:hypothetical protein